MVSDFPTTWKLLPLEDCMAAIIDYRGKSPTKSSFGIPLVTAKIVKGGRIDFSNLEYILPEDYDDWMRRGLPEPGDVVMTTEAPLGEIAQLNGRKVALAQRLITLRGKPGLLDNAFLKFAMQSHFVQRQLHARATGTTVVGVRQSELRKVMLPIPPLAEQQSIAHVLGALDDKIELNRRMNETLEAMARAIFRSWFVDFDPVRAKAEGRQPVGMDAETAALFPDSFVESELGEIPVGWQAVRFASQIDILSGGTPKTSVTDYWGGEVAWVAVPDTQPGPFITRTAKTITQAGVESSAARVLPAETLVITARGTVGNTALMAIPMAMNQSCYGLRGRNVVGQLFLLYQTREQIARLKTHAHGSVVTPNDSE